MIVISGIIRLIQELRAKSTAAQLDRLIHEKVTVRRNGELREIPGEELVVGDLILFSAGDRVPADIRLTKVTDLSVLLYILSNILLKTFLLPIYNNLSSITKYIFFFNLSYISNAIGQTSTLSNTLYKLCNLSG